MMNLQRGLLRQVVKSIQGGKRTKFELKHAPDGVHFGDFVGIGEDDVVVGGSRKSRMMKGVSLWCFGRWAWGVWAAVFVMMVAIFWRVCIFLLG